MADTKFKPGMPRPQNAGRKKGTPNKRSTELQAICDKHGVTPFEGLIAIAYGKDVEISHKLNALRELCKYLYPQLKAIEHSVDTKMIEAIENVENMTKEEQVKLLKLELKRLSDAK